MKRFGVLEAIDEVKHLIPRYLGVLLLQFEGLHDGCLGERVWGAFTIVGCLRLCRSYLVLEGGCVQACYDAAAKWERREERSSY